MKLLTKTDFILYRDCPNNVWVKIHKPEEYAKFPISEFEKSLGVMGNEVEELARELFVGGVMVEGRGAEAQERTEQLIAEKTPVIFQAVCATDQYLAAGDVLVWNTEAGLYDLYEIKMSSTKEENDDEAEEGKPKKVNPKKELQYEYDMAFQTNVFVMCGVIINNKYLVRLNKKYIKKGDVRSSLDELFMTEDKTVAVEKLLPTAWTEMKQAYDYLSASEAPQGRCVCYWTKGRSSHCTTFAYSNPDVPEYGVHDLNRIGNSKAYLKQLLDAEILTIDKVPEDEIPKPSKTKEGKPGKPRKLNQVQIHKSKEPRIDLDAIKIELDALTFPLYFLDYETYPTAVPVFNGYHPYQHIVFQYSLHVLKDKGAPLEHHELLILEGDPAEQIVAGLRSVIGDTGSVISWYKSFENARNRELARLVPLQFEFLQSVIDRTYDLMDIVEQQYYVHHGFKGSSSIKKVQPVLAPDFSYKKLGVQSGTDAIEAYRQITHGELVGEALEEKKRQMLEYCGYDTEVMYVLWKFFTDLIEEKNEKEK